jgi:hemoglobin-like flavoprotein
MTRDEVQLVRASLAKVLPIRTQVAAIFYQRLFKTAPQLRGMFPEDLTGQGDKVISAIRFVVGKLDRLRTIIPILQALSRRHVAYGVRDEHYDVVGGALIWTLETSLGRAFTPEVRKAWIEAYGMIAEAMIAAAHRAPERALRAA